MKRTNYFKTTHPLFSRQITAMINFEKMRKSNGDTYFLLEISFLKIYTKIDVFTQRLL